MQTIVDTHPHIVSPDTERYPITPLRGKRSDWSADHSVTLEELIAAMDEAGIAKACLVHSSTTYGFNNAYVADAVALHPKRFTGVFSVDITAEDAPQRMREWYGKGCTGMRIYTRGSTIATPWLAVDDASYAPAWTCASDLGIPVVVNLHCDADGMRQMANVMERYPRVRLLVDHLGRPPLDDGAPYAAAADFWRMSRFPNFFLKMTPQAFKNVIKGHATTETAVKKLVAEFGADRLMFGSNYPATSGRLTELLGRVTSAIACLPGSDQDWILGGTARKVYPALAD